MLIRGANSSGTCKAPVFHQCDCLSMDSPVLRIDAILHCAGGDGEGLGEAEGVGDGVGVRSPMGDDSGVGGGVISGLA